MSRRLSGSRASLWKGLPAAAAAEATPGNACWMTGTCSATGFVGPGPAGWNTEPGKNSENTRDERNGIELCNFFIETKRLFHSNHVYIEWPWTNSNWAKHRRSNNIKITTPSQ